MESSTRRKVIKVMILGDSGVGKSSILERYIKQTFNTSYKVTLGSDFLTMDLEVKGKKVRLQLWDTAGQEKYRSLSISYYRGSDACVFVYDVADKPSFQNLDGWVKIFFEQIAEAKRPGFPVMLFGNKADKQNRQVDTEEAKKWCAQQREPMPYFETSAKSGTGLAEGFTHLAGISVARALKDE